MANDEFLNLMKYSGRLVCSMSDEDQAKFRKEWDEQYQKYTSKVPIFPDHIEVMNIKLGLRICPWCKQSVYIGEQIKDIVALACPNCGGLLHAES